MVIPSRVGLHHGPPVSRPRRNSRAPSPPPRPEVGEERVARGGGARTPPRHLYYPDDSRLLGKLVFFNTRIMGGFKLFQDKYSASGSADAINQSASCYWQTGDFGIIKW